MSKSYSQAGQDLFVANLLNLRNGVFVDIGCNHPSFHNNTFLLETEFGWNGLLIDIDKSSIDQCIGTRSSKNIYLHQDLSKKSLEDIFVENNIASKIDYISFDVDELNIQLLRNFPFNRFSFKCCTFEHDLYRLGPQIKNEAISILSQNGYKLFKENVVATGYGEFEDWFVKE